MGLLTLARPRKRQLRARRWKDHLSLIAEDAAWAGEVKRAAAGDMHAFDQLSNEVQAVLRETGVSAVQALRSVRFLGEPGAIERILAHYRRATKHA